jgi:LysM repeat protein
MRSAKEYASTIAAASLAVTMATAALIVASSTTATASPHVLAPPPGAYATASNPRAVPQPDAHLISATSAPQSYTVASGDTLSGIAGAHLGGIATWTDLWHANLTAVPNPDLIYPGHVLTLPSGPVGGPVPPVHVVNTADVVAVAPNPGPHPFHGALVTHPAPIAHTPVTIPAPGGSVQQDIVIVFGAQSGCASNIINRESGGNVYATNPYSRAYGIPQALPGKKMASAGADWRTSAMTQLRWMLGYVNAVYGGACRAWAFWQGHHSY